MKIKYKKQQFQEDAARAVVNVFAGQPRYTRKYIIDPGSGAQLPMAEEGWGNHQIVIGRDAIRDHVQEIQHRSLIKPIDELQRRKTTKGEQSKAKDEERTVEAYDNTLIFTIEMETGVGKTYTYIKTMEELYRAYGWSKFIVVVPSIAIREGVNKSFEMTEEHFAEEYGKKVRHFIYNSAQPTQIEQFASDSGINCMIINTQAFNATTTGRSKDARRIRMTLDEFQSRRPIDIIAKANPILIIDEPQSVEGEKTLEGLKTFSPLFILRYSATHKMVYNMIYRLDAMDAYNKHLVKKIAVKGIEAHGGNASGGFLYMEGVNLSKGNPTATLQFDVKFDKTTKPKSRIVKEGDNLFALSNGLEEYRDSFVVTKIDGRDNSISFMNGIKIHSGDMVGKASEDTFRRIQIRETILSHIEREKSLFRQGIKVLSLFFIDEVANYRRYDEAGQAVNGKYADMFEEEYRDVVGNMQFGFGDDEYAAYLKAIDAHKTHAGYFSIDGKGKMINSRLSRRETTSDDVSAYDLIMKNKERLLDRDPKRSPVRFIFSHSALREGWDNPNVFQICTLKQSSSEVRKRQEVGRGLRLCVRQDGERMDENVLGAGVHDVNVLTVIASESYDSFARGLQHEIAESITDRPRKVTANLFENKTLTNAAGESHTVTSNEAVAIYMGMAKEGYLDDSENLTDKYYEEKKSGTLKFATCVKGFESAVTQILDTVYDPNTAMTTNGRDQPHLTLRAERLSMKEFKELWERINTKSYYVVHFGSGELVKKAVYALNEKLHVSAVYFNVETGSMGDIESVKELNEGEAFRKEESHEGANGGKSSALRRVKAHSHVPYDLIGMLVAKTGLTRSTIGSIMDGIKDSVFEQFQDNPEEFILKASQLIKESLADSVVEHITYNPIDKHYETGIFINADVKGIIADANGKNGNMVKVNKHLYDYVRYDSDVEWRFAKDIDADSRVAVYVKLPTEFYISTPVGKYTPDWAIAFYEGSVKHIYFVAETKGATMDSDLKGIERCKIDCAKEHFKAISGGEYIYDFVDTFEKLIDRLKR